MPFLNLYKKILKGIELEREHNYIDFEGNRSTFSKFMLGQILRLKKIVVMPDMNELNKAYQFFEQYSFDSLSGRLNSVSYVEKLLGGLYEEYIKQQKKLELKKALEEKLRTIADSNSPDLIDIRLIKGVGDKLAAVLNKLGISTVYDLFSYYPVKYVNYKKSNRISSLKIGDNASIIGKIKYSSIHPTKNLLYVHKVVITDNSADISVTFFYKKVNRVMLNRYKTMYPVGAMVSAVGVVKYDSYSDSLALDKAKIEIISEDYDKKGYRANESEIYPVYSLSESLNSKVLNRIIKNCFDDYSSSIKDIFPNFFLAKYSLMNKFDALKEVHFPTSDDKLAHARYRLAFEEFFLLQLYLNQIRRKTRSNANSVVLEHKKGGLVDKYIQSLPFELTSAQISAVNEILHDLSQKEPMQRLLQGDVGSGKTVVACIMLLAAVENGYQGAIMAPTEILALQHYKNFIEWLTPLNVSIGLFLGKLGAKSRREMQTGLKNGQINIAIGTHALIQDEVEFNNLGAVVVDEQHRFGVKQRANLLNKSTSPQMLTMTATPIPRTLALTCHGDLDVTVMKELPKGRKPIITKIITKGQMNSAYDLIETEILKGHQTYIVFPLIDESEAISAKCATKEAEILSSGRFKDYKIGLLHGKLKNEEKEAVTNDFKNKKYDILVSTTVVEVGVDVPNATVIMIQNSERFGLSQLHQLRGRVGRGTSQSYCLLTTDSSSQTVKTRLNVLVESNDGFYVAERDLELRGPGEFLGTRQSGISEFKIADIVADAEILESAREAAIEFLDNYDIQDFEGLALEMNKKDILNNLKSC
ncbi:ATP-dependent DNA helicase RecG [bacterium]|nr:ATP-dependent DNA helicase RecG [bacterium]